MTTRSFNVFGVHFLLCRYLISQGANVGVVNSEGETPLDIAEEEAMEELLQNEINRQGTTICTRTHTRLVVQLPLVQDNSGMHRSYLLILIEAEMIH